jgi:hypothetical protein
MNERKPNHDVAEHGIGIEDVAAAVRLPSSSAHRFNVRLGTAAPAECLGTSISPAG